MNHLGLFAKYWQPGQVKTRLATGIGFNRACRVYFAFLQHLLGRFQDAGDSRSIVFTPTSMETSFRNAIPVEWNLIPQCEGDLGVRMKTFFQQQFDSLNAEKIIIVGADCPQLTSTEVDQAFARLDRFEVVIGPSNDGGYYLLGMKSRCYDVFADIAWSTPSVLQNTKDHLRRLGVDFGLLATKTDVDDQTDLEQLIESWKRENQNSGIEHRQRSEPETEMCKLLFEVEAILAGPDELDESWSRR